MTLLIAIGSRPGLLLRMFHHVISLLHQCFSSLSSISHSFEISKVGNLLIFQQFWCPQHWKQIILQLHITVPDLSKILKLEYKIVNLCFIRHSCCSHLISSFRRYFAVAAITIFKHSLGPQSSRCWDNCRKQAILVSILRQLRSSTCWLYMLRLSTQWCLKIKTLSQFVGWNSEHIIKV